MITSKTIELEDNGEKLSFEIRKMSAVDGERWFLKALCLVGQGLNMDLDELSSNGLNANELVKALCKVPFDDSYVLMNELLSCVYRKIDKKMTEQVTIDTVSGYITNPINLMKLRIEVIKYNFDFFSKLKG